MQWGLRIFVSIIMKQKAKYNINGVIELLDADFLNHISNINGTNKQLINLRNIIL